MGHCNTIQAKYRDRNVERIQRQLKISELSCPRPSVGVQGRRSISSPVLL